MIKLRWLEIRKFRNVRPTRLTLNEGFNVLLGKNATGKTSLLKLIEAVLRDEKEGFPQESFDISYEIALDDLTLTIHCASRELEREPGRFNGKKKHDLSWHGRLVCKGKYFHFSSIDHPGCLRIDASIETTIAQASIEKICDSTPQDDLDEALGDLYLFSEGIARMDEGTETFQSIKKTTPSYWQSDEYEELVFLGSNLFPSGTFKNQPITWYESVHVGQTIGSGWNNGVPSKIANSLGLKDGQILAVIKKKDRGGEEAEINLGDIHFVFQRKDGSEFSDEYLSFGQKRFLTFLYLLWCNAHVCIADELVNGLHHAWIRQAIEEIGQRQAFLTSQNPILFDYIPLSSQQDAQRSFLLCSNEVDGKGAEWLVWKNVEEADARRIFEAYDSGLETLGQILETRGLW